MSVFSLPPGTDVLLARQAEMAGHAYGRLSRIPEPAGVTFVALVSRIAGLATILEVEPAPIRSIAAALPSQIGEGLHISYDAPWRAMAVVAPTFLAIEAKLAASTGVPAAPTGDVLEKMAAQVALDGRVHRHVEAFYEAMEILVERVLAAESTLASLATPSPATAPA